MNYVVTFLQEDYIKSDIFQGRAFDEIIRACQKKYPGCEVVVVEELEDYRI